MDGEYDLPSPDRYQVEIACELLQDAQEHLGIAVNCSPYLESTRHLSEKACTQMVKTWVEPAKALAREMLNVETPTESTREYYRLTCIGMCAHLFTFYIPYC